MDTNKNSYTLLYATGMVVIVALLLALVSGALKSKQKENEELDKKKQILSAINITESKDFEATYDEFITAAFLVDGSGQIVSEDRMEAFNMDVIKEFSKDSNDRRLPVFVATIDGDTKYVLSTHGAGLWGPVWGFVALNGDKNSVYGTYFAHASETPGLGAEISTKPFQDQFFGKKIMSESGDLLSIAIVKPGQTDSKRDYVDGISGGTITCKGVEDMLFMSLDKYEAFLKHNNDGGTE